LPNIQEISGLAGTPSHALLSRGLLGRGVLTEVKQTGVTIGPEWDRRRVLAFTVEVTVDRMPTYTTSCRQSIKPAMLPKLIAGMTVPVRVDRRDPSAIALDLKTSPPTITVTTPEWTAGVLSEGNRCRAVIVEAQELGRDDLHAVTLTVVADGRSPYWVRLGVPVPDAARSLLEPGTELPARRVSGHQVTIDWRAALAETELAAA
jgi:hypothetical protein